MKPTLALDCSTVQQATTFMALLGTATQKKLAPYSYRQRLRSRNASGQVRFSEFQAENGILVSVLLPRTYPVVHRGRFVVLNASIALAF